MQPYLPYAVMAGIAVGAPAVGLVLAAERPAAVAAAVDRPAAAAAERLAVAGRTSPDGSVLPGGSALAGRVGIAAPRAVANGERGPHSFYFTRGIYTDFRGGRGYGSFLGTWAIDYPKADRQFLTVLLRLTNLDAFDSENAVALDDPELRRFPFLYMLEVGYMDLTPEEIVGLRGYMLAGGFVFIDDFWGTREWLNFERQMQRVLPEYPIVDLPLDHPLFRSFYEITEIIQVPGIGTFRRWGGTRTHEQDGFEPHVRGVFDDDGRLMMLINWNTDLGDAWEWAEQPDYPLKFSTFAYQMGVNAIVYAMSH